MDLEGKVPCTISFTDYVCIFDKVGTLTRRAYSCPRGHGLKYHFPCQWSWHRHCLRSIALCHCVSSIRLGRIISNSSACYSLILLTVAVLMVIYSILLQDLQGMVVRFLIHSQSWSLYYVIEMHLVWYTLYKNRLVSTFLTWGSANVLPWSHIVAKPDFVRRRSDRHLFGRCNSPFDTWACAKLASTRRIPI